LVLPLYALPTRQQSAPSFIDAGAVTVYPHMLSVVAELLTKPGHLE